MASETTAIRRLLIGAGFALALSAAPLTVAVTGGPSAPVGPALASCPPNEQLDTASGACKPITDKTVAPSQNPINPENVPFQPGEVTSSRPGDVGSLPEVDGIPCSGAAGGASGTGDCIGLENSQSTHHAPHASINGQSVAPTP